jgi:hypothetical protein
MSEPGMIPVDVVANLLMDLWRSRIASSETATTLIGRQMPDSMQRWKP